MKPFWKIGSYSLFSELALLITLLFIAVVLPISWHTIQSFSDSKRDLSIHSLGVIAEKKSGETSAYINDHLDRINVFSNMASVKHAMREMGKAFRQGVDSRAYRDALSLYGPEINKLAIANGYYDIFLISVHGDIVHTKEHEADFATNLNTSTYKNSQLAIAYKEALTFFQSTNSTIELYAPSGKPAAFLATPILEDDEVLGVLALQFNVDEFNRVINILSGLGASGETIVGKKIGESVWVTIPLRHDPDAAFKLTVPINSPNSKSIQDAVNGFSGYGTHKDWRGIPVLAVWQYLPDMDLGMVVKIDESEAFASLYQTRNHIIIYILFAILLGYLAAIMVARHITEPASRLEALFDAFSKGERKLRAESSLVIQREFQKLAVGFNQMAEQIESSEQLLKTDRERLATAVDQSHDAIAITDPDGNVLYGNKAFERLSEHRMEEVIGKNMSIVKSGKMSDRFYRSMWKKLNSGQVFRAEFTNRTKSGKLYVVDQTISPIFDRDEKLTGFTTFQSDITEKNQEMKRLEHIQRLESLGVLAGGIAHDFNNLLTAILGNTSMIQTQIDPASPAMEMLNSIEEASHRAANLCKQMLAYSGKGKFIIKSVNLTKEIEAMINLLNVSISKNVTISLNLDRNLPSIQADVTQMHQVVMNLVINASEAIGDKKIGVISIYTGTVMADQNYLDSVMIGEVLNVGEYVFLEISDNGCGMSESVQRKVFDPFYSTKFTGRGLGMSAVQGIVRGHDGAIKIYSEADKGTTLKIIFPVSVDKKEAASTNMIIDKTWVGWGTALLIDDEKSLQRVAEVMLKDMGFDVILADDGFDGVEKFRQHRSEISVVILDLTMPNMDGKEAFRELRSIDPKVKVILSSGYNHQDATSNFAGKGLAGFIQKPYTYKMLKKTLFEILNQ